MIYSQVVMVTLAMAMTATVSFKTGSVRPASFYDRVAVSKKRNDVYNTISALSMAVTDAPKTVEFNGGGGMFTNSSPETKRVVPANLDGKVKMKIVYVVLESQYQSSLTKACNAINDGKEGVAVEAVGYLLEELRSPAVLEQFKADVADANIFIGSLIFVQELADKVCSCTHIMQIPCS
jgi:hypothetical protein